MERLPGGGGDDEVKLVCLSDCLPKSKHTPIGGVPTKLPAAVKNRLNEQRRQLALRLLQPMVNPAPNDIQRRMRDVYANFGDLTILDRLASRKGFLQR